MVGLTLERCLGDRVFDEASVDVRRRQSDALARQEDAP